MICLHLQHEQSSTDQKAALFLAHLLSGCIRSHSEMQWLLSRMKKEGQQEGAPQPQLAVDGVFREPRPLSECLTPFLCSSLRGIYEEGEVSLTP